MTQLWQAYVDDVIAISLAARSIYTLQQVQAKRSSTPTAIHGTTIVS
jgi:hypothetical protein